MQSLHEQIRRAVKRSPLTCYRIAKYAGVSPTQLSRLVRREGTLTVEVVEKIAAGLGLEITLRPAKHRRTRRAK